MSYIPDLSRLELAQADTGPKGGKQPALPPQQPGGARSNPYGRPNYAPNPYMQQWYPGVEEARRKKFAEDEASAKKQLDITLRVRRKVEQMLDQEAKVGRYYHGERLVEIWRGQYKADREIRRAVNDAYNLGDKMAKYRSNEYDIYRNPTPPQRRKEPYTIQLSRPPGSDPTAPPPTAEVYRWVPIPGTVMDDAEYVNYRRGYEEDRLRAERNRVLKRDRPGAIPNASKRVDRMSPLAPPDNYDYRSMPEYYYEYDGSQYIMRMDVPGNFPDLVAKRLAEEAERARLAEEKAAREAAEAEEARRAAAELAAQQEAERQRLEAERIEREKREAEEAAAAQAEADARREAQMEADRKRLRGDDAVGDIVNDEWVALPLPWGNADGFYHSMALLRALAEKDAIPGTPQNMSQRAKMREVATGWLNIGVAKPAANAGALPGTAERRRYEMLLEDDRLRNHLRGLPIEGESELSQMYRFGMPRALRKLNEARQKTGMAAWDDWGVPLLGPPPVNQSADAKRESKRRSLLVRLLANQRLDVSAWPTMYEVEALAWVLNEGPILLYGNDPTPQADGSYTQNWKRLDPVGIGPGSGPMRAVGSFAYRLLWSRDNAMRFRPVVHRDDYDKAIALLKQPRLAHGAHDGPQRDEDPYDARYAIKGAMGVDDKWDGMYQAQS